MACTATAAEKFCTKDGEISAPELDFLPESWSRERSRRFTSQYAFYCRARLLYRKRSWRGIFARGFIFTWSLVLNLEVLKIKV